jgi:hypothetical protein
MEFIRLLIAGTLTFMMAYLVANSAQAENNRLCEPANPVSLAIQSQYGIDANQEIYRNKTGATVVHIPLRNRAGTIQSYFDNAAEGATVIFEPGFYDLNTTLNINKSLHIVAKNHWMATAAERTRLLNTRMNVTASNVTIEGFEFRYGYKVTSIGNSRDEAINVIGNNAHILSNRFAWVGKDSIVPDNTGITIHILGARGTLIESNSFERNHGIAIKTDDHVRETVIRRNNFLRSSSEYWLGNEDQHPTAGEVAHLGNAVTDIHGNSSYSDAQRTIFERNYIEGWKIEMELISIKSDFNIIRDNLGIDNGIGSIVVRMGHNNLIERNILIDTVEQPFRISGSGNMLKDNFFSAKNEDVGPMIAIHRQMRYPDSTYPDCTFCYSYLAARMNQILENDFVGYGSAILWPDIVQQERLYTSGNVDFVEGDPVTEHNIFVKNRIYSANAERLITEIDESEAVVNISSLPQSTTWICANVPNFNLQ